MAFLQIDEILNQFVKSAKFCQEKKPATADLQRSSI
jgi:hypothetical protein